MMIIHHLIDYTESWPNCSDVSQEWECVNNYPKIFEGFHDDLNISMILMYCLLYSMCIFNTVCCYYILNQAEFKLNTLSLILQFRYMVNTACLTSAFMSHILMNLYGDSLIVVNFPPACYITLFFSKFFSTCSNWAEMLSMIYRYVMSAFPRHTQASFQTRMPFYLALTIIIAISIATNISDLLLPVATGCMQYGHGVCISRIPLDYLFTYHLVGFMVPIVVCLVLFFLLKRYDQVNSYSREFPVFCRTHIFGNASSAIFLVTTVPFVVVRNLQSWLYYHPHVCVLVSVNLVIGYAMDMLRYMGFCLDWVVFLVASPILQFRALDVINNRVSRVQNMLRFSYMERESYF